MSVLEFDSFVKLPEANPLRTSKTPNHTETPQNLQSEKPRALSTFMNDSAKEFNGLRDLGEVSGLTGVRSARSSAQPGAPESDVAAFCPASKGKCVRGTVEGPRRRTSRIKPPIIEVVYVPTKVDPYEEKIVYGILADWILADIEKEMKEKNDRYKPFSSQMWQEFGGLSKNTQRGIIMALIWHNPIIAA